MNGVIVINKPYGKTSHDMVNFIRRMTGIKKVGHTGTLDPAATGVLPICIGKATKAADLLTAADKAYCAELVLGMTTDTLDAEGEVLTEQPYEHISEDVLKKSIAKFIGEIEQIPPMFSAIKKDGKKLYELARAGITIEREKRKVRIEKIELLSFDQLAGIAKIRVYCTKGTYIRTLCEDIGMDLGCGAYMNSLERIKSGRFEIEESYTVEEIEKKCKSKELYKIITPVDELFSDFKKITLSKEKAERVVNGAKIKMDGLFEGECYRLYSPDEKFLSISEYKDGLLILKTAFWQ